MLRRSHKSNSDYIGDDHTTPGIGISSDSMGAGIPGERMKDQDDLKQTDILHKN